MTRCHGGVAAQRLPGQAAKQFAFWASSLVPTIHIHQKIYYAQCNTQTLLRMYGIHAYSPQARHSLVLSDSSLPTHTYSTILTGMHPP